VARTLPSTVSGHRGLVVLGGPQAAYDLDGAPWLRRELALVREALQTRTPFLGVCLGAQLAAVAAGGRAFKGPAPGIGFGEVRLSDEGRKDELFNVLPERFEAFHCHGDAYARPADAPNLAVSDAGLEQAARLGPFAWTVQFHLETTPAILRAMLERADLAAPGVEVDAVLAHAEVVEPVQRRLAHDLFDGWLDIGCID